MRRVFSLILAVGLMAALLALPAAVSAKAEFTPYTATETQIGGPVFDPPPPLWTGKIIQTSFESVFEDVASDPRVSGITEVSGKITFTDVATFTGIMSGTSVTEVDGYDATWVGHWQGKLVGGESFYKAVAHGTGELAGMKMMFTYDSTRTPAIEGRLLDPHGG